MLLAWEKWRQVYADDKFAYRTVGRAIHFLLTHKLSVAWEKWRFTAAAMARLHFLLAGGVNRKPVLEKKPAADTALHLATQRGDEAGILRLLKQGECVNARGGDDLETPLVRLFKWHNARCETDIDHVVQEMVAYGADQNIPDKDQQTALMAALSYYDTLSRRELHQPLLYTVPASVCITLIEAG